MNYILRFSFLGRRRIFSFLHPPAFPQRFSDNPLKLPVSAAELISCPLLKGIHGCSIYTEDKAFG